MCGSAPWRAMSASRAGVATRQRALPAELRSIDGRWTARGKRRGPGERPRLSHAHGARGAPEPAPAAPAGSASEAHARLAGGRHRPDEVVLRAGVGDEDVVEPLRLPRAIAERDVQHEPAPLRVGLLREHRLAGLDEPVQRDGRARVAAPQPQAEEAARLALERAARALDDDAGVQPLPAAQGGGRLDDLLGANDAAEVLAAGTVEAVE